jgi:hypothetical protein
MERFDDKGYSIQIADQRHYQAQKIDKFVVNFGQFYQLLLHITQIVYAELYANDPTAAFNRILLVTYFDLTPSLIVTYLLIGGDMSFLFVV